MFVREVRNAPVKVVEWGAKIFILLFNTMYRNNNFGSRVLRGGFKKVIYSTCNYSMTGGIVIYVQMVVGMRRIIAIVNKLAI